MKEITYITIGTKEKNVIFDSRVDIITEQKKQELQTQKEKAKQELKGV